MSSQARTKQNRATTEGDEHNGEYIRMYIFAKEAFAKQVGSSGLMENFNETRGKLICHLKLGQVLPFIYLLAQPGLWICSFVSVGQWGLSAKIMNGNGKGIKGKTQSPQKSRGGRNLLSSVCFCQPTNPIMTEKKEIAKQIISRICFFCHKKQKQH